MRKTLFVALLLAMAGMPVLAATSDPIVERQLDSLKLKYQVDKDGDYKLVYDLGNGRTQLVWVRSKTYAYRSNQIREIWSPGYRSPSDAIPERVANRMLENSNDVKLGGWVKQGKVGMFIIKVSTDASAEELGDAIRAAASTADDLEQEFSGKKDEF
ncbi:MAG: hypothetical protein JSR34_11030 [Proteobacteria bacterium]|nr:hypothetical protein [Pseudomonadota bacterium]